MVGPLMSTSLSYSVAKIVWVDRDGPECGDGMGRVMRCTVR